MKNNRPKFPYDVVIRDKVNEKVHYAKIVDAANAGEAKTIVVKHFGIELSRSEYTITAQRLTWRKWPNDRIEKG